MPDRTLTLSTFQDEAAALKTLASLSDGRWEVLPVDIPVFVPVARPRMDMAAILTRPKAVGNRRMQGGFLPLVVLYAIVAVPACWLMERLSQTVVDTPAPGLAVTLGGFVLDLAFLALAYRQLRRKGSMRIDRADGSDGVAVELSEPALSA